MQKRTLLALILILTVITIDIVWALLNYIYPVFLGFPVDLLPLIIGSAITDWLFLWYLIPLLAVPLYMLLSNITARRLVLPLNRLLNPGHEAFYFGPETPRPQPLLSLLRRSGFAVLLMLGIALSITKFFNLNYLSYIPELPPVFNEMNQATILMPLIFVGLALILPSSWLIEDCNIVFHTYTSSGPQELRNAGTTLITLLKGYAGIFVIVDYARLVYYIAGAAIAWQLHAWPWVPLWFFYFITFINPLIYIFMPLLALLLYYRVLPSLRDSLVQYMESIGTLKVTRIGDVDYDISEVLGREDLVAE